MNRLYDRNFLLAVGSQTCFMVAWTLTAHYARWIGHLGGDREEIGRVIGFGMIAGIALRPWIGQWINRLGARFVWGLGYALFAATALANLLIYELDWVIYLVRAGLMLAAGLTYGSSLTYITQNAPPQRRTEAIGTFGISGFAAMLIGPRLGEFILGVGEREREVFVVLFWTVAAVSVPAFLVLFFLKATPPEHRSPSIRLVDFVRTIRQHWPGIVTIVQVMFGVSMTIPFVFLADFVDDLELDKSSDGPISEFFLGYALTALMIRLFLRKLPDRAGRRKVLIGGLLMSAAGSGTLILVSSGALAGLMIPGILCGAGHGLGFHTMTSLTLERFPLDVRGSGSALALLLLDLGTFVSAPVLGWIAEHHGYEALFATIAGCVLVTTALFTAYSIPVWMRRARERST